jgi:hypothetical protein
MTADEPPSRYASRGRSIGVGALILGAWFLGPGMLATWLGPVLRNEPVLARMALGALILGLIWWHPVPWTGRVIPLLILAVGAFAWLEVVRRRALEEPSARPA